jgi:integrase/recombinase XerD
VHAAELPSVYGLRGLTNSTLFGLAAITGMRIKESLALDDKDVDLDNALIYIKQGKNGKDRFIPISSGTVEKLEIYRTKRNLICKGNSSAFFLNDKCQRPGDCGTRYNFAAVCQLIGLRKKERFHKHGTGPRFHDLRHTFAVRTIIDWYKKGLDVDIEMYKLSTYLGHTKPKYTYWYIEAVPELLSLASERAERLNQEMQK